MLERFKTEPRPESSLSIGERIFLKPWPVSTLAAKKRVRTKARQNLFSRSALDRLPRQPTWTKNRGSNRIRQIKPRIFAAIRVWTPGGGEQIFRGLFRFGVFHAARTQITPFCGDARYSHPFAGSLTAIRNPPDTPGHNRTWWICHNFPKLRSHRCGSATGWQ